MAERPPVPGYGIQDYVEHSLAALLSPVPGLAGLIQPIIQRRAVAWMKGVDDAVRDLQNRMDEADVELEIQADLLADVYLESANVALRTSAQEKLEWLKQGVLNTMAGKTTGDERLLLHYLDILTVPQLQLLIFLDDPGAGIDESKRQGLERMGLNSVMNMAQRQLPGWPQHEYNLLAAELHSNGLSKRDQLGGTMTGGVLQSHVTRRGRQLAQFIRDQTGDL